MHHLRVNLCSTGAVVNAFCTTAKTRRYLVHYAVWEQKTNDCIICLELWLVCTIQRCNASLRATDHTDLFWQFAGIQITLVGKPVQSSSFTSTRKGFCQCKPNQANNVVPSCLNLKFPPIETCLSPCPFQLQKWSERLQFVLRLIDENNFSLSRRHICFGLKSCFQNISGR